MIFVLLGWLIVWLVKLNQRINHQLCWRFNSSLQRALSCLPYTIPTSSNNISNQYLPALAPHTHIRTSVLGDSIFNGKLLLSHAHGLREAALQGRTTQRLNAILWLPGFNQCVYINNYKYIMRMYNVYTVVYWNYIIYLILSSKIT